MPKKFSMLRKEATKSSMIRKEKKKFHAKRKRQTFFMLRKEAKQSTVPWSRRPWWCHCSPGPTAPHGGPRACARPCPAPRWAWPAKKALARWGTWARRTSRPTPCPLRPSKGRRGRRQFCHRTRSCSTAHPGGWHRYPFGSLWPVLSTLGPPCSARPWGPPASNLTLSSASVWPQSLCK